MQVGKKLRMRRIFRHGRAVVVPMDHGLVFGPVPSLEEPASLVRRMAAAGADAILVSPGLLEHVADEVGDMAVMLRLDGTVSRLGKHLERTELISTVEDAARLGVEAVALNVYVGTENEDVLLRKLGAVAASCREHGMVLVGEMIPQSMLNAHYGREEVTGTPEERADHIATASRIGSEIGADIIKTNWSGSGASFKYVTTHAARPVLMAGGVKSDDPDVFLQGVREALDAGAAGVCAGRNVWERENMDAMLRAIAAMAHDDAPLETALSLTR